MKSESPQDCEGIAAALPLLQQTRERLGRSVLVGIGGPGGSGKSTFAARLALHLGEAALLPLDDYRKPRAERRRGIYGSHPEGNRLGLLTDHLQAVRAGGQVDRPIFCRARGAAHDTERLPNADFIIADGEISTHSGVREHFDLRILIHAGWRLQWCARMGRDRSQRSTSLLKALRLFWSSNLRDYPRFASGAQDEADLILRRSRCGQRLQLVLP